MSRIESLRAQEILDSRGRPTVYARCLLSSGHSGAASVPSGASTGSAEALELRDGDPQRHAGLGCLGAVENINVHIHQALAAQDFAEQADLDQRLLELDGSADKSRLGSNAILAVSLAFCRAQAAERGIELYRHLAVLAGRTPRLPAPMINLFSGGAHGGGQTAIQDVQLVMPAAASMRRSLEITSDIFRAAARLCADRYGMRLLTADEGGLAPAFASSEAMLATAVDAIEAAGYQPGSQVALTVDVAASQFHSPAGYAIDGELLDSPAMIDKIDSWLARYPIISVEDGLGESDWLGWQGLCRRLKDRAICLGDDLLCTNPGRIRRAIADQACDSLLLKVNQVGTLTEALESLRLARAAGWQVVISARSGETEDNWLADLAAGWAGDYIKVGSITQSERLAKYNRLLILESQHGLSLRP